MINVTKSFLPNRSSLEKYIDEIYESRWLTNFGILHNELEKRLKEYLGVPYLLLVSNGTLALQLCFRVLELQGKVITTPFSFIATSSSLAYEGLEPIFADIDQTTLNLSPDRVIEKLQPEVSAILPVHVYGNPCDVHTFEQIRKEKNIKVIYDAAHAFGVKLDNNSILNFGDLSTLSFHSTKLFHTIEGGAIITKDANIYQKLRDLINFGIRGPESIVSVGINAKMNEFQAAMGLAILDEIDNIIKERSRVTSRYDSEISPEIQKPLYKNTQSNHSYYPIIFKSESELLKIKRHLEKQGINTRRYFYPSLNTLPFLKSKDNCPVSENISARILCLPLYSDLSNHEVDRIIFELNEGLKT